MRTGVAEEANLKEEGAKQAELPEPDIKTLNKDDRVEINSDSDCWYLNSFLAPCVA